MTGAFKAPLHVGTGPVSTQPAALQTLVHVCAPRPAGIQAIAVWTLAPVGTVRVDAEAARAQVFHHVALVKVLPVVPAAHALWAQLLERGRAGLGTLLAVSVGLVPRLPAGAAAIALTCGARARGQAEATSVLVVAGSYIQYEQRICLNIII